MIYGKILIFKHFRKKIVYIVLSVIFLVALIFRLLFLGTNLPGLYVDELKLFLSAYAQLYHIGKTDKEPYNALGNLAANVVVLNNKIEGIYPFIV